MTGSVPSPYMYWETWAHGAEAVPLPWRASMCWVREGRRGEAIANAVRPATARRLEIIIDEAEGLRSDREREKDEIGGKTNGIA